MTTSFKPELLDAAAESVRESRKRERMLYAAILIGVIWSFTYTAISLLIMYGVASQSSITCDQFAESRDEVRAVLLTGDDVTGVHIDIETLDEILPRIECD
jgi:hypothetical protein